MKAVTSLIDDVDVAAEIGEHLVAWVEGPAHAPVMKVAPVDVAGILADAICGTSGTEPRAHQRHHPPAPPRPPRPGRRAATPSSTSAAPSTSPTTPSSTAPPTCPIPGTPDYEHAMHDELDALISAAGGRTLALFTSWRAMRAAADALRTAAAVAAADAGRAAQARAARRVHRPTRRRACSPPWASGRASTSPAPRCSSSSIDRLPFPRPDEPLLQARRERARADAFRIIDLPAPPRCWPRARAASSASRTDRGVVAVLDSRLAAGRLPMADLLRATATDAPHRPRARRRAVPRRSARELAVQ